jgi:deazaflavin-dependent oxidoreductase (nitroreductase family)
MPVLELVSVGRKSGRPRQILIGYTDDGGVPVLIGTNAGRDVDPAWVQNLRAEPDARARWDGAWHDVAAVEATGAEHERLWALATAVNEGYERYRESLTRVVPIVRLELR